ncbi:MAG: hypothetical protein ACI3V2_04275 [Faecousia sp.]
MERREPEQLNQTDQADAPEEYRLDDILREFGAGADEPKESVSSDTMTFQPIRSAPVDPQPDAPTKTAKPKKSRLSREKLEKSEPEPEKPKPVQRETVQQPPTRKEAPAQRRAPEEPQAKPKKRAKVSPEQPQRREARRSAETPPKVRIAMPEAAPKPQELLRRCKDGSGTQRLRLLFLGIVTLLQLLLMFCAEPKWNFLPLSASGIGWCSLALGVLSLAVAYDVLLEGVRDLLRLRVSLNTLAVPVSLLTFLHAVQVLPQGGQTFFPVLSLLLFFLLRALAAQRRAMFYTLRTVCSFDTPMGIYETPQQPASLRRDTADTEDFMRCLLRPDLTQNAMRVYALVMLPLTGVLAYLLSVRSTSGFVQAWLLLLLGAIPFAGALCFAKPFAALAKRLASFGGALCGWHGAKAFHGKHTIILRDEDIFPRSHISSNGMKLFGAHTAPRVIAFALAALEAEESPLTELFESLLRSQNGRRCHAAKSRIYDNNGIGAEVMGEVVLVGTLAFMRSMGVHMPAGTRVRQAVYVSVGGELAGIFAIKYKPSASTKKGLRDVLANRNFSVVLATRDFLITPELIASKYDVQTQTMVFPAFPERLRLSASDSHETDAQGALIAKDTFGAFASTVAAGRTLHSAALLSLILCLLAGIGGLLVCALLIAWNSAETASPLHLAAFQLVWACLNAIFTFVLLRF